MDFRTKAFAVKALSVFEPIALRNDLEVVSRAIDDGISPYDLIKRKQISPIELAAVLAVKGLENGDGLGLPLQTGLPINSQAKANLIPGFWSKQFPDFPETSILNLAAGLLQIYDFWEESHCAAQRADDLGEHRLSAHWHAICHRREPDAFNANYWWGRVGRNPLAQILGNIVSESAIGQSPGIRHLADKILEGDSFNDRAMVAQSIAVKDFSEEAAFLRRLQKYEMLLLIDLTIDQLT